MYTNLSSALTRIAQLETRAAECAKLEQRLGVCYVVIMLLSVVIIATIIHNLP